MDEFFTRAIHAIVTRVSGLFYFRFIMQPLVAVAIALRAGYRDAAAHEPAYLWAIVSDASGRRVRIASGWTGVGIVAIIALVVIEFRWIYPLQALIIAFA